MSITRFAPLLAAFLLAGCGEKSDTPAVAPTNTASGSVVTAPADYLGSLAKAQRNAVGTVDLTSVNKAIQMFEVDRGRLPKDLNELVESKFLPKLPDTPYGTRLDYDPNNGIVRLVKQ